MFQSFSTETIIHDHQRQIEHYLEASDRSEKQGSRQADNQGRPSLSAQLRRVGQIFRGGAGRKQS